ncbi:BMP family lipoprotein [Paenibacillus sedimenti]|uniref:BMP family ABC transporter substrate-binding protein n=1 Tax=Paenibacillus sedimenti TaxID=2770274 RepID=A0A926KRJ7_9BACL|nr:BMP family ABC transporter substrate-binding protein [Paenibacillus sedimenti]MBD0382008.1 BMP family ABC transporter substrate-binding protein [Paenibacillus sedimenti]
MKKVLSTALMAVTVTAMALTGCAAKKEETKPAASPAASPAATAAAPANNTGKDFKIGMVTDIGGVNDKSFNQSAWEGLKGLEKQTGAKVKNLESKSDADYVPNLNQFVKDGYNLTWGIGFLMGDALKTVATQNPNAKLAIIDNVVEAPNVESVTFSEQEGSYLVGVVAGLTTKSNKIGFVGGIDIPVIKRFEAGFIAGVKAVNPNAKVQINYTGAFDKPDLGKAAAATIYNDGADIIFHAAGSTGNGVFNEAKDRAKAGKKVWVIGVDKDQSLEFGDDVTLTSMLKRVDTAVARVSKDVVDNKFQGGKTVVLGLKEDGVGLPETSKKNVSADILKKVDEYKAKIISGEIKVPATPTP